MPELVFPCKTTMRILQLRMDVDEFGEFLRTIGIEPMCLSGTLVKG